MRSLLQFSMMAALLICANTHLITDERKSMGHVGDLALAPRETRLFVSTP
ncbi:MAG: hypothetical protein ACOYXA_06230 [Bacteroidota bacterium]